MLPPGTRAPAFWQTYRYITRPLEYSRESVAAFGDVARVRALNGRGIIVSSPELAKLVFAADPDNFDSPLFVVGIMLLILGVQSVLMGLIAELLVRTYHESQRKPTYTVKRVLGTDSAIQRFSESPNP
jgi:hypothetical protein